MGDPSGRKASEKKGKKMSSATELSTGIKEGGDVAPLRSEGVSLDDLFNT